MQRPRGTRDLTGEDLERIQYVEQNLEKVFSRYGYEEIRTPIFEHLELFTTKSGSEIVDQIYHFEDKSNRKLALRPELTAPSIRLYNNRLRSKAKPLKIFYAGPCFRYERPQAERWRQFLQAGVELIGSDRPEADAEVIALTNDVFSELDFEDYSLRLGHIGLLRSVLDFGGVSGEDQDPLLRAIDSNEDDRISEELESSGISEGVEDMVWQLIEMRGGLDVIDEAEDLVSEIPEAEEVIDNFRSIQKRLGQMGVEDYEIDWGIARGLEYYTGSVFEVYTGDVQLGGGGRYDDLIESLGCESTPAVGVGFGVDRMASSFEEQNGNIGEKRLDAMILPTDDSMLRDCLEIAMDLRKRGFRVDVDLMGRSLSKSLSYADSRNAKYSLIVGPQDMSEGRVTLKDMESGTQEKVFREAVFERLKN